MKKRKDIIYLDAPSLGDLEKKYLNKAIDTGYVSIVGPFVAEFENKFAQYLKVNKAVSVQSGTAGLHISLYELGIKKGDEVIVPALTFVATVNPIVYVGAKPVFVDVELDTWNISPYKIEKAVTRNTKAIIPVHIYGNPCNMDEIMRIAKKYNLYVIEDATESLGAKYKDKFTGTYGIFGIFSFNGNKLITTGGGGMVVGNDESKLNHVKLLVNQARDLSHKGYYHSEIGFNYRMTNIEAAIGLAQFERMVEFLNKKRLFYHIYKEELGRHFKISFQNEYEGSESSHWLTCITIKGVNIEVLQNKLLEYGIQTRRVFTPVVEFPMYSNRDEYSKYENAYAIYENGLCLPSSTLNSEDDIYYVCKVLKKLL